MSKHKRDTFKLGFVKYLAWYKEVFYRWVKEYFDGTHFPKHIVPDLAALESLIQDYENAITMHREYKAITAAARDTATANFKRCYLALKQIKIALGTLPDHENIRAEFGIMGPLPMHREKIHLTAQNALGYWEQVKTEPMYMPFADLFANLAGSYAVFDSSRSRYYKLAQDRAAWQNKKVDTRASLYAIDRGVFRWYRSLYPNPRDEWWTQTPWGKRT